MYTYFMYGLRVEAIEVETLEVVGSMFLDIDQTIKSVHVNPEHRRRGVATGMYQFLTREGFTLKHSDSVSEDGKKWIESLDRDKVSTCQDSR
jgi:ribosomal protein S18 acetylase RimI-like enzyme